MRSCDFLWGRDLRTLQKNILDSAGRKSLRNIEKSKCWSGIYSQRLSSKTPSPSQWDRCSQRTLQFWNREAWQYSTDAGCYIENPFIQAMPYPPVVQRNSTFAHAAVAGEYLQRLCPGYLSRTRWDSQDTTLVVSWMKMGELCFGMPTLHRGIFHGLYMPILLVCVNLNDSTSESTPEVLPAKDSLLTIVCWCHALLEWHS